MSCKTKTQDIDNICLGSGSTAICDPDPVETVQGNPHFQEWFNGSKVCNDDGSPLMVFHGSPNNDIQEFVPTSGRRTNIHGEYTVTSGCFFFSPNVKMADYFAQNRTEEENYRVYPCYLNIKQPLDMSEISPELLEILMLTGEYEFYDDNGYPVFSIYDEDGNEETELIESIAYDLEPDQFFRLLDKPEFIEKVKKDYGYDGFILMEHDGSTSYAVMDSKQIKSADKNSGAFDGNSANIYQ